MHSLILHVISNPTPSGKHIQSHILRFIWKSHPLWQAHTKSHNTRHVKIPPPLASTCTVSSYTSNQNPTPSGKYMHSLILHVISKSHPLWQVHAQSHLTRHIKIPPPLASTCKVTSYTSYQNPTPSGKYMHSLILHVISKSHPLWQVHAQSHLTRHIKSHPLWQAHTKSHLTVHMKIPPPLASTYKVTSYGSYENPTGKYMHSLILHVISKSPPPLASTCTVSSYTSYQIPPPLASTCTVSSYTSYQNPTPSGKNKDSHISHYTIKIPPPLASTCKVTSYTSYQNPTPSGKYMRSLILHVISKSHPLWQVHAKSHLTRHIKIPTPSGKYMHSLILHISKSHPLWQVHAQSHLTRHIKIPPPLASTCKVTSYTSYQNLTPLWQVHAQSHLTRHIKIPPPLASTYKVTSYGSYENPTPSGKHIQSHILHVMSKSHPLWQVHAQSHLTRHIKIPPPLASTRTATSHITRSKSHPLWQVHARSHLTRHIKIPPPLASTCAVSSYTSYQNPTPSGKYMRSLILHVISNPTPSGKYMQGHILHVISKSHPLWQVHAQSHLTRHIKIPPPLASTCAVSSYTSYQNPTPSGKYTRSLILHIISKSHPLWQVHAQSHLTRHIKIPPPLASTCAVSSYTFTDLGLRNIVYEPCYESWFTNHGLRAMVYESWFTKHSLRAMVYRSRSQPFKAAQRNARVGDLWILHTPGMDQRRRRRHSSEEGGASGDMLGLPFCCQSACLVVVIWFHHVSSCFIMFHVQSISIMPFLWMTIPTHDDSDGVSPRTCAKPRGAGSGMCPSRWALIVSVTRDAWERVLNKVQPRNMINL